MDDQHRQPGGVLLVEDNSAVREALAQLLEDAGVAVCAQAGNREEALKSVAAHTPALAVVDLSLGQDGGLQMVADLHGLGVPVVVFSSHEEQHYVRRVLDLGARAYVAKRDAASVARTVRDVLAGWVMISPRAAEGLTHEPGAGLGAGAGQ